MKRPGELTIFRAFRSRNYQLYFFGRAVSQLGTWMQRMGVIWVVYSITHSLLLVGVTIFAEQSPSFLFSFWGGVAADRYDRYKVIQITQVTSMAQAVLLAVLVLTGHAQVWSILVLSVILGIINAFDVPARQSLLNEVVTDHADLPNAISLTTATASFAQLAGPALSGFLINGFGAAVCFFANAASFGGVMLSLWLMDIKWPAPKKSGKKVWAEFAEGIRYVVQTPEIGTLVLMLCFISLLVLPYNTLLPGFAHLVYKGDARTYGLINTYISVGAVAGTIYLASRKPGAPLKRILLISTMVMGIGLLFFAELKLFAVAMFFAALTGFGAIAQFTICNISIQSDAAPAMRGRAIGVLLMAIFGMLPLGSVLVGWVSEWIGAPATMLIQGIIAIIIALCFIRFLMKKPPKPAVRNIDTDETDELIAER